MNHNRWVIASALGLILFSALACFSSHWLGVVFFLLAMFCGLSLQVRMEMRRDAALLAEVCAERLVGKPVESGSRDKPVHNL